MKIEQDSLGRTKQWIYIAAAGVLFIAWCLSLAALTGSGGIDGRVGWVFGLCFLTVPALIYQSLTPIWSRTARYSNPHAHCAVDGVLVLFWFSAWVSLASYVISGKGKGTNKDEKASGCDNFAHGSASKCKISEADIFFCVMLMGCFAATAWFSFRVLMDYRRTGIAPNAAFTSTSKPAGKQDRGYEGGTGYKEDDEAFDSRLDVHGDARRESGYSFEEAEVQGGANGGYAGLGLPQPYGGVGYESVPNPGAEMDGYSRNGRPTSFGGPLGGSRL